MTYLYIMKKELTNDLYLKYILSILFFLNKLHRTLCDKYFRSYVSFNILKRFDHAAKQNDFIKYY